MPISVLAYDAIRCHLANSAAGEGLLDFPTADLNGCGTSYGSGGYRWGAS